MGVKKKSENTYSNIEEQFAVEQGYQNFVPRNLLIASSKTNDEISSENSMPLKTRQNQVAENRRQKTRAPTICGIKLSLLKCGLLILLLLFLLFFLIILTIYFSLYFFLPSILKQNVEKYTSVILLGGYKNEITDSTLIYNSTGKSWVDCRLKLPFNVLKHGSIILDGEIYIFGGSKSSENNTGISSVYKLGNNSEWEKMAEMNEIRSSIGSSYLVFNSELWVFGGWGGTPGGKVLKTVEKYNPKNNNWTMMPSMNERRSSSSATIVDGKIYISGGWDMNYPKKTIEVYNSAKGEWDLFGYLPTELGSHSSISNGTKLIIIGGDVANYEPTNKVWEIDVLDPNKKWKKLPSLLHKRCYHGVVELEDGLMALGGTLNEKTQIDSVEVFDGHSWKADTSLPEKRGRFSIVPLNSEQETRFFNEIC